MNDGFQVRPVRTYDKASYPSRPEQGDQREEAPGLGRKAAAVALCALTLLFLASCARQTEAIVVVPGQPSLPVVVVTPQQAQCAPSELRCRDERTLELCQGGAWVVKDCLQHCREQHGDEYLSNGCSTSAADPCQCAPDPSYDMVDGGMGYVEPSMF